MSLAAKLGVLSASTIGLAFASQWYVMTRLGAGTETDALFAGMTIPQLVLAVVSGSLTHVLVPLLAGEPADEFRRETWGFIALIAGLFGFLAIGLHATATWWVPLTVPGFSPDGLTLTVQLTRIQLLGMVFTAITAVQWAAYHARQQFLWAEFTPFLTSLAGLAATVWALPRFGVVSVAWIATLRLGVQSLLLVRGLGRPVWPDLRRPALQLAWSRIKPLLLGTAFYKTDPALDRFLLSSAGSGTLSLYNLGQQIYGAISQVMGKALAAPLVPVLSTLHKSGDMNGFRRAYTRKLAQVAAAGLAVLLVLIFAGRPLLLLVLGHGNLSPGEVRALWWLMIWLGGMFLGGVMGQVTSSTFYSLGDTTTPTRLGIISYTIYVPFKVGLYHVFGAAGLALSTSAFYTANLFFQHLLLKSGHLKPGAGDSTR